MRIGPKIYFDKQTGTPIVTTAQVSGDVVNTTVEQDFMAFKALSERVPETVGMIQLEYGEYEMDFSESLSYRVNPETLELEFTYPDPNAPENPPVFVAPLTEQVAQLRAADLDNKEAIASLFEMVLMGGGI